jgi:hypothetical protein
MWTDRARHVRTHEVIFLGGYSQEWTDKNKVKQGVGAGRGYQLFGARFSLENVPQKALVSTTACGRRFAKTMRTRRARQNSINKIRPHR